jgi:hypothetical protein
LHEEWKESISVLIRRAIKQIVVIIGTYHTQNFIQYPAAVKLTPYVEEIIGDRQRGF